MCSCIAGALKFFEHSYSGNLKRIDYCTVVCDNSIFRVELIPDEGKPLREDPKSITCGSMHSGDNSILIFVTHGGRIWTVEREKNFYV